MARVLNVEVVSVVKDQVVCRDKDGRAVTIQLNRHEGEKWRVGEKLRVGPKK